MQLTFTGRNFEVTEALKTVTTEKLQRLLNRDPNIIKIAVVFSLVDINHIAEANVHMKGFDFHAKAENTDMYASIDALVDKLLTQLTKHKEKKIDQHR